MKKIYLLIIAAVIMIICSVVICLPHIDTTIGCNGVSSSGNNSYIYMYLYYNDTDENGNKDYVYLPNQTLEVKMTDKNGDTTIHHLTTNSSGEAKIGNLSKGKYNVTVSFNGNSVYGASKWNGTINLNPKIYRYNGTYFKTYYTPYRYNNTYYTYRYYPSSGNVRYRYVYYYY